MLTYLFQYLWIVYLGSIHQATLRCVLAASSFLDLFHRPVIDVELLRDPLHQPWGLVLEASLVPFFTIAVYDRLDHTDQFVGIFDVSIASFRRSSRHSFPTALELPLSDSRLALAQPTSTSETFPYPWLPRTGTRPRIS